LATGPLFAKQDLSVAGGSEATGLFPFTSIKYISIGSMEGVDVELAALVQGSTFRFTSRTSTEGGDIVEVAAVMQGSFALTKGLLISEILTICSVLGLIEASINVRVI
jgi:hypothetical protein